MTYLTAILSALAGLAWFCLCGGLTVVAFHRFSWQKRWYGAITLLIACVLLSAAAWAGLVAGVFVAWRQF